MGGLSGYYDNTDFDDREVVLSCFGWRESPLESKISKSAVELETDDTADSYDAKQNRGFLKFEAGEGAWEPGVFPSYTSGGFCGHGGIIHGGGICRPRFWTRHLPEEASQIRPRVCIHPICRISLRDLFNPPPALPLQIICKTDD